MGRSAKRAIDSLIEKKINSARMLNSSVRYLYNYSKFIDSRKYEFHKYCFQYGGLLGAENSEPRVDIYNNKFYNLYDSKIKKTRCKFNLLKLFKPGELLTSVSGM